MLEYITLEELQAALRKSSLTEQETTELNHIREAVSRAVEDYLNVEEGYFIPPPELPTTERVYGTGASFIDLPSPVFGEVTVSTSSTFTVPNFTIEDNRLISLTEDDLRSPYIVWGAGVPFDVSGRWGYEFIPPQLKEACLEIAVGTFRERPENGFQGMVGSMQGYEGVIRRGWPASARMILDNLLPKIVNELGTGTTPYIA